MLTAKRRKMREALTFAGASQLLIVGMLTWIGGDLAGWKGAIGGFFLSYLLMGFQTIGMWTTSNLARMMVKAGKAAATRPIDWLYSWPVFLWRAWKFVMTEDYAPDF